MASFGVSLDHMMTNIYLYSQSPNLYLLSKNVVCKNGLIRRRWFHQFCIKKRDCSFDKQEVMKNIVATVCIQQPLLSRVSRDELTTFNNALTELQKRFQRGRPCDTAVLDGVIDKVKDAISATRPPPPPYSFEELTSMEMLEQDVSPYTHLSQKQVLEYQLQTMVEYKFLPKIFLCFLDGKIQSLPEDIKQLLLSGDCLVDYHGQQALWQYARSIMQTHVWEYYHKPLKDKETERTCQWFPDSTYRNTDDNPVQMTDMLCNVCRLMICDEWTCCQPPIPCLSKERLYLAYQERFEDMFRRRVSDYNFGKLEAASKELYHRSFAEDYKHKKGWWCSPATDSPKILLIGGLSRSLYDIIHNGIPIDANAAKTIIKTLKEQYSKQS